MFETIGILTAWLFGGVAVFYLPILTSGKWAKTGDGLSDLAAGLWIGGDHPDEIDTPYSVGAEAISRVLARPVTVAEAAEVLLAEFEVIEPVQSRC